MHTRRTAHLSSLVLPHPPLPTRPPSISSRSSSSSASNPSPCTPRSSASQLSPVLFKLDAGGPRRSTDSWGSSIQDGGDDDMDWEWTNEQLRLLNKALDALPSHLLSPFSGSFLPGNTLDKICRSIISAKNPLEWPHSLRSTRLMLLKIVKHRSEELKGREDRHSLELAPDVLQPTSNNIPKKPLYRQSSMDFIKGNALKTEKSLDRLSVRLQRVDRYITNPNCAYSSEISRSSSPALSSSALSDSPHTPRIQTEDYRGPPSSLSIGRRSSRLRRSTTVECGLPTIPAGLPSDHISTISPSYRTAPKIKRSESFSSPHMLGIGHTLKRAPSYGSVSARSIDSSRMSVDENVAPSEAIDLDIYPSTDDEEKSRSRSIKKQKTIIFDTISKDKKPNSVSKAQSSATLKAKKPSSAASKNSTTRTRKDSAKKLTRTSSMFGAELPHPQPEQTPPALRAPLPKPEIPFELPIENIEPPTESPNRRLRRVKTTNFPPRMRRRISFGHLSSPIENPNENTLGLGLQSAFEMQ